MKCARLIVCLVLTLFVSATWAQESLDSLVLSRVFSYQRQHANGSTSFSSNFYSKFMYDVKRRNLGLWLIPHMYTIARGDHTFLSEQYGRLHVYDLNDYEHESQVYYTTIPRNRRTMPILNEFMTPSLYSVLVYGDHILSPFHQDNRRFYHYTVAPLERGRIRLYFRPRHVKNTQLMTGVATIETKTGRIIEASFEGEYDLIHFQTVAMMGEEGVRSLLPKYCHSDITFSFMGNKVVSTFEAVTDCPIRLSDTISVVGNREMIDSLRPLSLSPEEQAIYDDYDRRHAPDTTVVETPDTLAEEELKHKNLKDIGQDIGELFVTSLRTESDKYILKASPILEPQYLSYSASKGFSYKMKFRAEYYFNPISGIYFNPEIGYNWKFHEFRFNLPLRYIYNNRNNSYLELLWRNGNRIGNNAILDEIKSEQGYQEASLYDDLDLFNDAEWRLYNNVQFSEHLSMETGLVYHRRRAINEQHLQQFGKSTIFQSFAPAIGIKARPWLKGPLFSIDYERSIGGSNNSLNYERWEADASMRHYLTSLQTFNFRLGGGLYTKKESSYFTDFANFRDNNLPEGWNDDWTGNFQLLDSRLYNESQYYIRSNISYEAPLLIAVFTPLVGRHVERERFYWSGLLIEHSRPYSELGYGFSSRYFSIGFFASFLNVEFQRFGTKFTFELFSRW